MYQQQWNNDHIYLGLDSPELEADMSLARANLAELAGFIDGLDQVSGNTDALPDFLREVRLRAQRIRNIGWNVAILAACKGSQDARDVLAKQLASRARALNADLFKTLAPVVLAHAGGIPVEFHTHCNTGLGLLCTLEAIRCGIHIVGDATWRPGNDLVFDHNQPVSLRHDDRRTGLWLCRADGRR